MGHHTFVRDKAMSLTRCTPPPLGGERRPGWCDGCGREITDRALRELTPEEYALATLRPTNVGLSLLVDAGRV